MQVGLPEAFFLQLLFAAARDGLLAPAASGWYNKGALEAQV
jgi:hypothetical protein